MAFKDIKGLKRLQFEFPVYVVQAESVSFGGRTLRKNGLLIWYRGEMVYCDRFPRKYAGNNPMLEVCYYDFDFEAWGDTYAEKSMYTKLLWAVWRSGGYKKVQAPNNYEELMKHDRRHKRGSGQREITATITDYDCCHTPCMRPGRWGHIEGYWNTCNL